MEEEAPSIQFDHSGTGYPRSLERLQAEIYLLKDANTTKQVIEIPADHIDGALAKQLATKLKLKLLKEGDNFYLVDPKLDTAVLPKAIQNGEHGEEMGYGSKSCPTEGVDYGVSTSGDGSTDPAEILEMRNSNRLGFAGRAADDDQAQAKMAEMGGCLCKCCKEADDVA
jgi:hypothetical protein